MVHRQITRLFVYIRTRGVTSAQVAFIYKIIRVIAIIGITLQLMV